MSRVNSCCPSADCTAPLLVPVPKASLVASTFERPSTTVSAAVRFAAASGRIPVVAMAPAARPVLRKLRRVIEVTLTSVWLKPVGRAGSVNVSTHAGEIGQHILLCHGPNVYRPPGMGGPDRRPTGVRARDLCGSLCVLRANFCSRQHVQADRSTGSIDKLVADQRGRGTR